MHICTTTRRPSPPRYGPRYVETLLPHLRYSKGDMVAVHGWWNYVVSIDAIERVPADRVNGSKKARGESVRRRPRETTGVDDGPPQDVLPRAPDGDGPALLLPRPRPRRGRRRRVRGGPLRRRRRRALLPRRALRQLERARRRRRREAARPAAGRRPPRAPRRAPAAPPGHRVNLLKTPAASESAARDEDGARGGDEARAGGRGSDAEVARGRGGP